MCVERKYYNNVKRYCIKNLLLGFLLTSVLAVVACNKSVEHQPEQGFSLTDTMMTSLKTAPAQTQTIQNELKLFGKISADKNKLVEVFPVVGGYVTSVNVELGDHVQKGQLLATIRSTEVAGYEKDRLNADNDVLLAEKNLQVTRDLFKSKLNSEKDVLTAENELAKAKAEQNRIHEVFNIYSMKSGASYEVRAPVSGFIIEKKINIDMQLRSDRTDNIFDIAELSEVWVLANVNESDIASIRLGEDAQIRTISYPDKIFHGKIDKIFNVIDPDTKAMKVRIKIPNDGYLLKPDMNATVTLHYAEDKSMIAVPAASIIFDKSKNFVMVFHDRYNIETRMVTVYRQVGDIAYISDGLKENENVITHNQLLIYDELND